MELEMVPLTSKCPVMEIPPGPDGHEVDDGLKHEGGNKANDIEGVILSKTCWHLQVENGNSIDDVQVLSHARCSLRRQDKLSTDEEGRGGSHVWSMLSGKWVISHIDLVKCRRALTKYQSKKTNA
jgi:hypothetical protein